MTDNRIKILNVVGARPNLMKIAPLLKEMKKIPQFNPLLVHTGQHYDDALSQIFFKQLDIPAPDFNLHVGSGSHSHQTAQVMIGLENLFVELKPDLVLVVGDVNSTLAAALVSSKLRIPLAHVEAGLRSHDRSMPEEINRILTDSVSNFLFVTEASGVENLKKEGLEHFLNDGLPIGEAQAIPSPGQNGFALETGLERCGAFVGNVMIDTLLALKSSVDALAEVRIPDGDFALMTLHRPGNVDDAETLKRILDTLALVSERIPILFPCHPRTKTRIEDFGLGSYFKTFPSVPANPPKAAITMLEPAGYMEFLKIASRAKLVLTDSGGIQEETTILGVPCLTLRENTERPVTITSGTNTLVGTNPERILECVNTVLNGYVLPAGPPPLWDGRASERIVSILRTLFCS